MKATDLLGAEAVDTDGRRLGRVHDVRLARSGQDAAWRIDAVVVGPSALAYRLGYAEHVVDGPRLLAALACRLGRRNRPVPWARVVSFRQRRLVVRPGDERSAS
ncbi:PRC-barrel domain-containing protein [Streptomyces sp. DH24]|uniref:PRC-barrel domain-containing protein n=1 Tax=Streptomyces sp. DH24 TaxID=3040123 RepID=UPI002442187A|nr:PRC-barrel domain-containing protein [Streptomyces sp. DH24]MDG9715611.1 PRC-barrel domain-containing protein [Streptomyces sp. DH24]